MTPADLMIARRLADQLVASCSPFDHWDDLEALTLDQARALDTIAFECQACNHWHLVAERIEDRRGQWICRDCAQTELPQEGKP